MELLFICRYFSINSQTIKLKSEFLWNKLKCTDFQVFLCLCIDIWDCRTWIENDWKNVNGGFDEDKNFHSNDSFGFAFDAQNNTAGKNNIESNHNVDEFYSFIDNKKFFDWWTDSLAGMEANIDINGNNA